MSDSTEIIVDLPWGSLSGLEHRGNSPRTAVALHGWLDTASSFTPLSEQLDGYPALIAFDLAGHGKSSHRPASSRYELIDYAFDILDALESLELKQVDLIGHSLGGVVAMICAAIAPQAVHTLTLIDSLGPLPRPAHTVPQSIARYRAASRSLAAKTPPVYSSLEEVGIARAKVGDLTPALAVALLSRSLVRTDQGWMWRSDPRLRLPTPRVFFESEVTQCLEAVDCPVLLITADPGLFRDSYPLEQRLKSLRNVEHHTLKGGHHIHLEKPKAVASLFGNFLRGCR